MLLLTYLLVLFSLIGLDQFSKYLVISHFDIGESLEIIRDFFSIHYVRNYGAGFSILQDQTVFLSMISLIVVCALFYLLYTTKNTEKMYKASYLMIISGALGNFIDRIRLSYVIDFLDFNIFGYDFPVFNVADCFITVGCFLLMFLIMMENKNA
ncbi:MAG: signal peptidase II [Erysipelotrichaceae bacterium]|nr:signal peptidase II [Erysipelotrichaceae bacterium]